MVPAKTEAHLSILALIHVHLVAEDHKGEAFRIAGACLQVQATVSHCLSLRD